MKKTRFVSALTFVYLGIAIPAGAQSIQSGSASAFDVDVDVSALGLITLAAGPLATASVSSSTPASDTGSGAQLNANLLLGNLTAGNGADGALNASASTTVDGVSSTATSQGQSVINGLSLEIVPGVLLTPDLLSITSTTIGSSSTSNGAGGILTSFGASTIEDLAITVAGVAISIPANPAPNTALVINVPGVSGISIILNEQIVSGNGTTLTGITTNALRVSLDAVSFGTVSAINGDIIIGQSSSGLQAIPEPAAALLGGLGMLLLIRRRRCQANEG